MADRKTYKYTCPRCRNVKLSARSVDYECPKCGFKATRKEEVKNG
jgi:predicted RNA-binding Zn-ribbon protein involved in translation (DUF1610 family)